MIVEIPCMVPGVLIGYEIRPLWEMVIPIATIKLGGIFGHFESK